MKATEEDDNYNQKRICMMIMTSVRPLFRPGGGQDALTETADLSKRRNITTPDTLMDLVR